MRKALHELATGYAAATGCACEAEEGSCQAVLSVEGLGIHIGLAESSGMIVFQTGAALVVTQMPGGTVDWMAVGSAVIVAGVASLGTSLAGLPELEKGDKA